MREVVRIDTLLPVKDMLRKMLWFYDLPADDKNFQYIINKFDQDVDDIVSGKFIMPEELE